MADITNNHRSVSLAVNHVNKVYHSGSHSLTVLRDINFEIAAGATVAIVGPSGSGKTTLLGLCAGLDRVTSGEIILNGIPLNGLSEDERAGVRNHHVGFIFQNFQLLPTLTALENIMVPLELRGKRNAKEIAVSLLGKVGLSGRGHHYPSQLSGGEQQRISIARAFANSPKILFADEPTGNLDADTGEHIEQLLFALNRDAGTTLVMVTHDPELAARTQRIIYMKGGVIIDDKPTQPAHS